MLLPEIKERESRFKLALRMGLPIFALILAFISSSLITSYESLSSTFYFTSILLLVFSIYFIFFLIYRGFDEGITEVVSKTFTREYLYKLLQKKLKSEYTLMLLSVDNLADINTKYGIKNGDKVLHETVQHINKYLKDKKIYNFPIGHIKGGDFIIGLEGYKEEYTTIIELFYLKNSELKIDNIEVNLSGALVDTKFSSNLEYMIEDLFEIQEENKDKKNSIKKINIDPNTLESYVLEAVKKERINLLVQDVYGNKQTVIREYFNRLQDPSGKNLHPKSYMKIIAKLDLMAEYDYLMLKNSINTCLKTEEEIFCITIDSTSLRNSVFLEKLNTLLDNYPQIKGRIIFMLSEVHYYSQIQKYNFTLQTLRKKGIQIALDKLGSLHTSFLYLRELDIDIVRFDSIYAKQEYKSMLKGLNTLSHEKGVKTWVKMLQTEESDNYAQEIAIDYRQGNILSEIKHRNTNEIR